MKRTAADAALTRQAIREAAIAVFSEHGWSGATFQSIAVAAGVTRGAVYHHFTDKTQLLIEAVTDAWQHHTEPAIAHLSDPDTQPADRLVAFLDAYLTRLATNEAFRHLAVVSTLVAPQVLATKTTPAVTKPAAAKPAAPETAAAETAKADAMGRWADLLRDLAVTGGATQIGLTPDLAVDLVLTFLNGVTVTAAVEPHRLPTAADARRVAVAITRAVLAHPAQATALDTQTTPTGATA